MSHGESPLVIKCYIVIHGESPLIIECYISDKISAISTRCCLPEIIRIISTITTITTTIIMIIIVTITIISTTNITSYFPASDRLRVASEALHCQCTREEGGNKARGNKQHSGNRDVTESHHSEEQNAKKL